MGDAKDAGVFILFFPGILLPVIFLFKWMVVRIFRKSGSATPLGQVTIASLLDSVTPTVSLITLPAFSALNLMERRWFRIGSFLMILCIIDCVINYVVFKGTARSKAGAGGGYRAQGLERKSMTNGRKTLLFLFAFFVLNWSVCFAQLSTLNLVYSGVGGLSDVVKFAHEEGFFKKNGLDVTLVYVNSGVLASQVVASGTAGAAAITATDALRVMSAGVPMKIIMVNIDQFQHLFVARPGIKKPGDMKGKRVAVSRYGSFSDIQTRFLIRQWGMEPDKDVQILQIGNSAARAAALANGGVDGAIVTPFFIPSAKKAGLNVIFDLSTINAKFANQIVIVNDNLIKEKRTAVRAFTRGLIDAIRVWRAGSEATRAYLKKNYELPDADIENIQAESRRFIRSEPTPDLESVQAVWDNTPDLKTRGITDFGKFVDGSFVTEVLREAK